MFRELARVQQYFMRIKDLEFVPKNSIMTIDKQAAARFIKWLCESFLNAHPKMREALTQREARSEKRRLIWSGRRGKPKSEPWPAEGSTGRR